MRCIIESLAITHTELETAGSLASTALHDAHTSAHAHATATTASTASGGTRLTSFESALGESIVLLTGGVANSLINRKDSAGGFTGCGENVQADHLGLPDEFLVHVVDIAFNDIDSLPETLSIVLDVDLSKFVENIGRVHAGVISELTWDNLESLSESADDHLLLTTDGTDVLTEESRKFHLDGTTTSDDGVCLDGSKDDHNSIIERAGSLSNVLGSASSKDNSNRLGVGAFSEHVVSLRSELSLFEFTSVTENRRFETVSSSLENGTSGLADALEIILRDATSAENVSVSEVLSGQVTDRELGENNVGSGLDDLLELVVDDLPFGINNLLEIIRVGKSDLSGVLLGLKLKLEVKGDDLGLVERLGGLLETSVREGLSEANTHDKERVGDRATSDHLDSNVFFVEVFINGHDGIDDHGGEESLLLGDNLGVEGSLGALLEELTLLSGSLVADLDGDFLDAIQAHLEGLSVTSNDDGRVHAFLDEGLGLTEELSGGEHDGSGAITDLVVLGLGDVDESLGGGVNDIKKSNKGGAIVGDGNATSVMDKLVHSSWS